MKFLIYSLFSILIVPSVGWGWSFFGSNDPQIDINATVSVYEGNSSVTAVQLTITASECPDTSEIKIHWETAENGSATSGIDFQNLNGDITFDAPSLGGDSCTPLLRTKNITVYINGDTAYEPNETFLVNLSDGGTDSSQKYHFGQDHTTVTILNDDPQTLNTPPIMGDIPTQYADVNQAYSFDISPYVTPTDGDEILSYGLSGSLPSGLSFDSSTGVISGTPTTTGTWTVNVTATDKDGTSNTDSFDIVVRTASNEVHSTADDLCYDWIDYEPDGFPAFCIDFGIVKGGINCKQTISIRNQGNDTLSDVRVVLDTTGFSGDFLSECGIDDVEGNCEENNLFDMGPMGIFGQSIVYDPMPNYDANDSHTIYDKALISMAIFSGQNLYGTYTKGGESYVGEIRPCGGNYDYQVGRIDAWDTFRDNTSTPPDDRNLSTKIVQSPFQISIGTLNRDKTEYAILPGTGEITVGIYDEETQTRVSQEVENFDVREQSHQSQSDAFTVTRAVSKARVGFKICLVQERNTSTGEWIYEVHPAADCSGDVVACNVRTRNGVPQWHLCYSSDAFAIRPKSFTIDRSALSEPVKSGNDFILTLKALDAEGNPCNDYNETVTVEGLSPTLSYRDANGSQGCMTGVLDNRTIAQFRNGETNITLSYNEVGDLNLSIHEVIGSEFAAVDNDDTDFNSSSNDSGNQDDGPIYRSIENNNTVVAFIPDHFDFTLLELHDAHESPDANFTYLASDGSAHTQIDSTMAAKLRIDITAKNLEGNTTENYNERCYAKNLTNLRLNYRINGVKADITTPGKVEELLYKWSDDNATPNEGEGYVDLAEYADLQGSATIPKAIFNLGHKGTAKLTIRLNFDRRYDIPVNPFTFTVKDINVSDSDGVVDLNDSAATTTNVTFLYARTQPSQTYYDGVTVSSLATPIMIQIYCDKGTAAGCPQIDMTNGATPDYRWWIATAHTGGADGNITLSGSGGSVVPAEPNPLSFVNGIDNNVTVNNGGNTPNVVAIDFGSSSNSWLIHNPDTDAIPSPFYEVRFIGTGSWSGVGKTGNVVGGSIYKKKTNRVDW